MMKRAMRFFVVPALALLATLASMSVHAAYVDNGDGTVSDTVTGLMWDKCPYGQTANDCSGGSAFRFTWAQALVQTVALNGINYKGHNDWRLPSIRELESLVLIRLTHPAIDDIAFPNTDVTQWYWSSTLTAHDTSSAWAVPFQTGDVNSLDWTLTANKSFVRLVRDGQPDDAFDLLAPIPTSMTANAGTTPQSATVGTAFANPLAVTVKDAGNNPVSGVNVTFTAPGAGASGVFSNSTTSIAVQTNASGVASAPFTANAIAGGPYIVAAAAAGLTTVNFSLTNTGGAAATMTANAGTTPQSANINTAFANPLGVTVKDAGNNPVSGINVTFTAPGAGASGVFSNSTASIVVQTNASGVASAPFTANATAGGPYSATAAAAGVATVNFSLTNTAGAGAQRTFVSGEGLDTNACSLSAPCRTFAVAISRTAPGGEVVIKDSAGYGPVTISKPISIVAPAGIYAGVSVLSGTGIIVSPGSGRVALKGLVISGLGGVHGIDFQSGDVLDLDDVVVKGFGAAGSFGLRAIPSAGGQVRIRNSVFSANDTGVGALPLSGTAVEMRIDRSKFLGNAHGLSFAGANTRAIVTSSIISSGATGVTVQPGIPGAAAKVEIRNTTIGNNSIAGLLMGVMASAPATVSLITSQVTENNAGIAVNAGSTVYVSDTTITRNTTGISVASGVAVSLGDNRVTGNLTDGSFTSTVGKQ